MALEQQYRLKGMDLRSSHINRPADHATDIINMEPDSSGSWVKRRGFDLKATLASAIDSIEYKKANEHIVLTPTLLRKQVGASIENITLGGSLPANGWSEKASWAEYNGVLYWTDPSGKTDLFKYDGYMAYKAGMPKVVASVDPGEFPQAPIKYFRVVYYFIDLQGNVVWGDFTELNEDVTVPEITVDSLNGTEFHSKHGNSSLNETISSSLLIKQVTSGHNYVPGDWIRALSLLEGFIPIQIESVTATTITFTSNSVGTNSFFFLGGQPLEKRLFFSVFISDNESFGFVESQQVHLVINTPNSTLSFNIFEEPAGVVLVPMEDIYDTTVIKGLPPRFKYITIYNNIMVGANQSIGNEFLAEEDTSNNPEDEMFWSDLGVGSTVETFGPFDRTTIGRSDEGAIGGLFSASDSMIIFKEKQVYYINGILTGRFFRTRSALTNGIGCISHRSIQEMQGGCLFMSSRGLYYAKSGAGPIELSDVIEPLFTQDTTGLILSSSTTIISEKDEKVYIYIPALSSVDDIVVVYDYYWKDWFKYTNIKAINGFILLNNDIYHIDISGNIYQRDPTNPRDPLPNDNGLSIKGEYSTGWWDMGSPSLRKKFIRFILISIGPQTWIASIKSQLDWIETDSTNETIQLTNNIKVDEHVLNKHKNKAIRFIITNSILQEMLITGYEFEWEWANTKPKGES